MNLKALAGKVPHRIKGTLSKDGYEVSEGVADSADILKKQKRSEFLLRHTLPACLLFRLRKPAKTKFRLQ